MSVPNLSVRPRRRGPALTLPPAVIVLLALISGLCSFPALAQEPAPASPSQTPTPAPTPIPAAEIPLRAEQTAVELRQLVVAATPRDSVAQIEAAAAAQRKKLETLAAASRQQLAHGASRSQLEDLDKRWLREEATLDGWLATLQARSTALEADLARVREIGELWKLTLASADEQDLPAALRGTISTALNVAANAKSAVSRRRDEVLTLQTEITGIKLDIREARVPIREAIAEHRRNALLPGQPPIWTVSLHPAPGAADLAQRIRERSADQRMSIRSYVDEERGRVLLHAVLFVVALVVLSVVSRWAAHQAIDDGSLLAAARLLGRPLAAAVLLSTLLAGWIHPAAPKAWYDLLEVLLLIALLRLLPRMLPKGLGPGIYLIVILFILKHTLALVPEDLLLYRAVLLGLSAVSLGSLLWLARRLSAAKDVAHPIWNRAIIRACWIGAALTAAAFLANVVGSVALADTLTDGLLNSVFTALMVWVGAVLVQGAEAVILRTNAARRLNMVRNSAARIRSVTGKLVRVVAIALWAWFTLAGFRILEPVAKVAARLAAVKIGLGDFKFSPLTILTVAIAAWFIFKLSRFVRFFLETDVIPRVELPRGVPSTISKITTYIILTIGFFVVVGMLGLDLGKVAIIAGALSVGIGFGLQNVVNNFVSGLILLFERPIKEGDSVELAALSGVVEKIGMRASIVRTWQGADVIVPNATFISSEIVNWTLRTQLRRIDIQVGVAYGTDPDQVIELLCEVAHRHPEVLPDPQPLALFVRFGESSLDFELRAWVAVDFPRVGSELRVAVNRALKDAGIEIPFPQRDLHLRTGFPEGGQLVNPTDGDPAT